MVWALIAAELFLCWLNPMPIAPRYVTATSFGIRGNEPNRTSRHFSADFEIEIRTNAQGIRADEDIPYRKPDGVKRIVVLGDSFGMGYEVNLEDTFLVRMENQLKRSGYNVQIVNLSVSGHGNAEELLMLQHEGSKYEPDMVLLCWHRSDLKDNIRSNLFQLDGEQLIADNSSYLPGVSIQAKLYQIPGYDWIQANTNLYAFMREWISWNVAKPLLVALRSKPAKARENAKKGPTVVPKVDYPTQLTVALLHEIQQLSTKGQCKFAVFDIPDHRNNRTFWSKLPKDAKGTHYGLPVVGVIDTLRAHAGEGLYWTRSQRHFTPLGCRLVGDELAVYIIEKRLLDLSAE